MNPATIKRFKTRLRAWYLANQRLLPWRETKNPYHIWVSEVMLQQTQVITVIDYFNRFIARFPDIESLARAELTEILKLWEGLGYYSRARHLHRAAQELVLNNFPKVPDAPEKFRELPGVGDYINAAVQSIAFGHPLAVVDGNVKRVLSRVFLIDTPVNQSGAHALFSQHATRVLDTDDPSTANQAMMELGAMVCKPGVPQCEGCPVSLFCMAFKTEKTGDFPKRVAPKKIPVREMVAGLILRKGRFLVIQRKPDGFLGGLWELPGGVLDKNHPKEKSLEKAILTQTGLHVRVLDHLTDVKHAYTHFKLRLSVYVCDLSPTTLGPETRENIRWIKPEEIDDYPFHKAMHKCFPAVISWVKNRGGVECQVIKDHAESATVN